MLYDARRMMSAPLCMQVKSYAEEQEELELKVRSNRNSDRKQPAECLSALMGSQQNALQSCRPLTSQASNLTAAHRQRSAVETRPRMVLCSTIHRWRLTAQSRRSATATRTRPAKSAPPRCGQLHCRAAAECCARLCDCVHCMLVERPVRSCHSSQSPPATPSANHACRPVPGTCCCAMAATVGSTCTAWTRS